MMLTFRAGKLAALIVALAALGACSREQQDWRSAEATDTVEGYGQFLERHPDSELATEARTRVAQLSEDLEWQHAGTTDNAEAYKQFLAQHPNGKWAQEARIRIENFALGRAGTVSAPGVSGAVPVEAPAGVSGAAVANSDGTRAFPGEEARAQTSVPAWRDESAGAQAGAAGSTIGPTRMLPGAGVTIAQAPPGATSANAAVQPPPAAAAQAMSTAWRSDDGFGVQLGAFASENAATTEWQQLTARFSAELHGLSPRVVSANTSTGRLFRLQALVADEARARALCEVLRKQSQACVPVLPH